MISLDVVLFILSLYFVVRIKNFLPLVGLNTLGLGFGSHAITLWLCFCLVLLVYRKTKPTARLLRFWCRTWHNKLLVRKPSGFVSKVGVRINWGWLGFSYVFFGIHGLCTWIGVQILKYVIPSALSLYRLLNWSRAWSWTSNPTVFEFVKESNSGFIQSPHIKNIKVFTKEYHR